MASVSRLIPCLAVLVLASCSNPASEARSRLKRVDVTQLRGDATKLFTQLHSSPGPEFTVLKISDWPESFKKLKPVRVGSYPDGFAFVLAGVAGNESGIHVQPIGMDQMPEAKLFRYERLEEGVFVFQGKHGK